MDGIEVIVLNSMRNIHSAMFLIQATLAMEIVRMDHTTQKSVAGMLGCWDEGVCDWLLC